MNKYESVLKLIPAQGVLPLFFCSDKEVAVETLCALYRAGIRVAEFTNRCKEALDNFKAMRSECDTGLKGMYIGAGTIKNGEQAKAFIDAGADFLVSPGFAPGVAEVAMQHNVLYIPGCMTPSEIMAAENRGSKLIKLFPGNLLTPQFVTITKPLFPGLMFMPTGGVAASKQNIIDWFTAGVSAVGIGSQLISTAMLEAKDYVKIETQIRAVLEIIAAVRPK